MITYPLLLETCVSAEFTDMPKLDDPIHLDMYQGYLRQNSFLRKLAARARRIASGFSFRSEVYGYEWGDPGSCPPLGYVRDHFVAPFVDASQTALEIGPGGGRWTQYLLGFKELYVVDYHSELLAELKKNFGQPNIKFIKNSGSDFPGVMDRSIDYLFCFGTFVHLELDLIDSYLKNMRRILKPGGNAIIQYSDMTKVMARSNEGFSKNTPDQMRQLVAKNGFEILEEDLTTLWHSSIVRFTA